jgi:hypothetical protein
MVAIGYDIAWIAPVTIKATEPGRIILIALAIAPSQGVLDRQVWKIGTAHVRPCGYRAYLALAALD